MMEIGILHRDNDHSCVSTLVLADADTKSMVLAFGLGVVFGWTIGRGP